MTKSEFEYIVEQAELENADDLYEIVENALEGLVILDKYDGEDK